MNDLNKRKGFANLMRTESKKETSISDKEFQKKCFDEMSSRFSTLTRKEPFTLGVVDWFHGEKVRDNDIVICDNGMTASYDDFSEDSYLNLGERGWNTVVRIYLNEIVKDS